jgi:hypothetical protein
LKDVKLVHRELSERLQISCVMSQASNKAQFLEC